jgi:poly-gamma-glutamate synthase PgsB/CapB
MSWVLGITIAAFAYLLVEAALLRRAAHAIPQRIVVTGSRGKSSLVQTLLAGIREEEPASWGKITGDIPSVLVPHGTNRILPRRGPAHLREQARFLWSCRRQRARCVVVESMSISPEAMAAEMRLIRPTLVVVTNVRDDHRETLGGDPDGQRTAYLESLPARCTWLTLDAELLAFTARSSRYPAPVRVAAEDDSHGDIRSEMFSAAEAALEVLGWNTEGARGAAQAAAARIVMQPRNVVFLGEDTTLLDAFSANDPESLARLWAEWRRDSGDVSKWSVLLNTRADRPIRTRQFCDWLSSRHDVDEVYVTGSHSSTATRLLRRERLRATRLPSGVPAISPGTDRTPSRAECRKVLVGIGNARGLGLRLRTDPGGGVQ